MSTRDNLIQDIRGLCELQRFEGFILAGIKITEEEGALVANLLKADEPSVGAEGRLFGVPIFIKNQLRVNEVVRKGEYKALSYTYIELDVVD